jgi:alpha-acetolactate decarboxylase
VVQMVIADGSFKHTIDHGRQVPTHFADYDRSSLTLQVKADTENDITIVLPE